MPIVVAGGGPSVRIEQLTLQVPGDEFRLRFHEHLTVIAGIGVLERQALVDSLVLGLAGVAPGTSVDYRDGTGRLVRVRNLLDHSEATYDDGTPAMGLVDLLRRDEKQLRELLVITPADLGLDLADGSNEAPELAEARATLTALTEELSAAYGTQRTVQALSEEVAQLDERIRLAEETKARRQYARLLADLERARSEAAALRGGVEAADSDRRVVAVAEPARALGARWRQADDVARELAAMVDDAQLLDPATRDVVRDMPDDEPAELESLARSLEDLEARRLALSIALREMAASRLPEPSDPAVRELARADQDALWAAHRRVQATATAVEAQEVALGGVSLDHDAPDSSGTSLADAIEREHQLVLSAEERIGRSRRLGVISGGGGVAVAAAAAAVAPLAAPVVLAGAAGAAGWALLSPRRRLARAEQREQATLAKAGATSYLSFHLRRVDAMLTPDSREQLEAAALEHRLALSAWSELAGTLAHRDAGPLEAEVRAYAASLADLGHAAREIEEVRRELEEDVEPAVERARQALLAVCRPFGVDDPFLAVELVRHRVREGRVARAQVKIESARAAEEALRAELDRLLATAGFVEGDLASRLGAYEWAFARATERERARGHGRDLREVEGELAALEDEARRSRRPEWATVTASDANEPDIDELMARRQAAAAALSTSRPLVPDIQRLADRHAALDRRVAALESAQRGGRAETGPVADTNAVRQYLLAHLTQANHAGAQGDSVPVLVDDALARLQGDAKWDLLDLLERTGATTQVIYLTDDPLVGAWARRRAAMSAITLLEPASSSSL